MKPELAADDWGFSKGINEGILDLAECGLVRVVSLIATAPYLDYQLAELKKIRGVKFAWHLNFTAGAPLETMPKNSRLICQSSGLFQPFKQFLLNWMLGRIAFEDLRREARAQATALRNRIGNISEADGHHHVHLVPGLINLLAPIYDEMNITTVRLPLEKGHIPSYLGSQIIKLRKNKFPQFRLRSYGYPQDRHFKDRQSFLQTTRNGKWPVLVHPAAFDDFSGNPFGDPLCGARVVQYEVLKEWFA